MQSQAVLAVPFDSQSSAGKELAKTVKDETSNDLLTTYLTALQEQVGVSINETLWRQVSGISQTNP
jgi:hypothetical protein